MSRHLQRLNHDWAKEKTVRRFYKELGLKGETPVFKTTRQGKHPYGRFAYLLRNKPILYANQVWATDVTYIKTPRGMMYFTATIDLYSRKILSWSLGDHMTKEWCMNCVLEAINRYGVPAIFNSDNGSQYTSKEFIQMLQSYDIRISMDGIGSCKDNIYVERTWRTLKYEWIFLRDYGSEKELRKSLAEFVSFFNSERIHQSLEYKTPDEVYNAGTFADVICEEDKLIA